MACLLSIAPVHSQNAAAAKYRRVNDSMVACFNRNDFKGIYRLGNDFFKANQSEDDCVHDFSSEKKNTGDITTTELSADLGGVQYFTWYGKNANARLELRVEDGMMKQYRFGGFVLQPGSPPAPILTNNPLKTHLDSVVHQYAVIYMAAPSAVSLSIGVYRNGEKHIYNYGEVKKGSGVVPNSNTIYQVGSIAKTFIGVLLGRAVADKKMQLGDDVRKYLPGSYPNLSYKGQPITLQDLANHTGGFRQFNFITYPPGIDSMPWNDFMHYLYAYPKESVINDLHRLKVDTLPGVERNYSVGGFIILGMALESVYHQPLNTIFNDYYGKTLHMGNTWLNAPESDSANFAIPYDEKGHAELPMLRSTPGLFTVKSTVADMLKYVEANVKENDLGILLSHKPGWGDPTNFAVGLGWQVFDTWEWGLKINHSGHDAGYNALCTAYPNEGLGFVLLQNENGRQGTLYILERSLFQSLQRK